MSDRWQLPDHSDIYSALRHSVMPLVTGSIATAIEAAQAGAWTKEATRAAIVTAIVSVASGVLRLVQRWASEIQ